MKIFDKEFAFSSLNANDIERLEQAKAKLEKAEEAERQRAQQTPNMSYAEGIRGQCRIFMDYLDNVLGEGASEKLGLDGSNFNACLTVSKAFAEAMAAEKASVSALIHPAEERAQVSAAQAIPAPMNREQRRAAVKAHPAMVDFRAQEAAKAARRAQLKAELEALDNA